MRVTDAGFDPAYSDDSSIHFSDHGPFSDERINFPGEYAARRPEHDHHHRWTPKA